MKWYLLLRLTNEIHCLQNEVKELKQQQIVPKNKIIPTKPFANMEEFLEFETKIQEDADAYSTFVSLTFFYFYVCYEL